MAPEKADVAGRPKSSVFSIDMERPNCDEIAAKMREVQDDICKFIVDNNGGVIFHEDNWQHTKGAGGGRSRLWEGGVNELLEKAGVNFSDVGGSDLPKASSGSPLADVPPNTPFRATGVSLVLHPRNPNIPTIHMNIRFFEAGAKWWFGGGIDLTPYYPQFEQVQQFHLMLQSLCQSHNQPYPKYKQICDDYFTLKHRDEMRGVGGIFFDNLCDVDREGKPSGYTREQIFDFVIGLGMMFKYLYAPFLENANMPYTEAQREYQLWRRSRYVEFNLLWDRGTKFGIESKGRTESILMSLPTTARWYYNYAPRVGTVEHVVQTFYLQPQDWVNLDSTKDNPKAHVDAPFDFEDKVAKAASCRLSGPCNFTSAAIGFAVGVAVTAGFGLLFKRLHCKK